MTQIAICAGEHLLLWTAFLPRLSWPLSPLYSKYSWFSFFPFPLFHPTLPHLYLPAGREHRCWLLQTPQSSLCASASSSVVSGQEPLGECLHHGDGRAPHERFKASACFPGSYFTAPIPALLTSLCIRLSNQSPLGLSV